MKGYIEIGLVLEVDGGDLENWEVEQWVIDEMWKTKIHKDIKVVQVNSNALEFDKGIEDGFEDLFF